MHIASIRGNNKDGIMKGKKVLAIQDISCVGQCSITAVLPVMSHFGMETAILPTAILSNHTMYKTWSYFDFAPQFESVFDAWKQNGIKFDGYVLGYLGSKKYMELSEKIFSEFSNEGAKVIIDPVFGDNGKLYPGFDENYVSAVRQFISLADVIVPNITEACYLADLPVPSVCDEEYVQKLVGRLSGLTRGTIIITGVEKDNCIGEAIFSEGRIQYVFDEKLPRFFHGTGDIFTAAYAAHKLNGMSDEQCCRIAGRFVADCIRATGDNHPYGVQFEDVMKDSLK